MIEKMEFGDPTGSMDLEGLNCPSTCFSYCRCWPFDYVGESSAASNCLMSMND